MVQGVLALSLDSGILLGASKDLYKYDIRRSYYQSSPSSAPAPLRLRPQPGEAPSVVYSDDVLNELLGLTSIKSPYSQSYGGTAPVHSGDSHHNLGSELEPMQLAASLFVIYKNASEHASAMPDNAPSATNNTHSDYKCMHGQASHTGFSIQPPALRSIQQGL